MIKRIEHQAMNTVGQKTCSFNRPYPLHCWEVTGQLHASAAFPPRKKPRVQIMDRMISRRASHSGCSGGEEKLPIAELNSKLKLIKPPGKWTAKSHAVVGLSFNVNKTTTMVNPSATHMLEKK